MPPRKRSDPPPISTASSRRISDRKTARNLSNTGASTRKIPNCSVTGQCSCNEVGCGPGTCCTKENQCGECSPQDKVQELCLQKCEKDVEAMIDEMQCCREMIRSLAHETMDILQAKIPKHDCGATTQNDPALQKSSPRNTLSKGSCHVMCNTSAENLVKPPNQVKPIVQRQNSSCSNKKCEASASKTPSGIERRSACQLQHLSHTPTKSPSASRRSSNSRIALTAYQKSDGRLGKKENCVCTEQRMKQKSQMSITKTPSNCSCAKKENKTKQGCKKCCPKLIDSKPAQEASDCSCVKEIKKSIADIKSSCDEVEKKKNKDSKGQKTPEKKLSDCSCEVVLKKQGIDKKTDSKSCLQKIVGDKTSECSCEVGKETEAKKGDNKSLDKTFGRKSTDNLHVAIDECKNKVESVKVREIKPKIDINNRIRPSSSCSVPTCVANTCTCHFPPAYGQYFDCTGHVAGNCHCDKNV